MGDKESIIKQIVEQGKIKGRLSTKYISDKLEEDDFDPDKVDLFFESAAGKIQIMKDGVGTDFSEETATKILSEDAILATADLKSGDAEACAWGCDLTHEYVNINADYRS